MHHAIGLARLCPRSPTAYSVGAVIVGADNIELAHGFSRETDEKVHAEESALNKLGTDPRLAHATLYSTLEPCSHRASQDRRPCTDRILAAGIPRVVIAWREPALFVENCVGVEKLREHGIEVIELADMAEEAMSMNRHLELS
ncbi:dCMP deaminase [Nocardia transvalensis]|uniref:dCMP deaminase n=1 Tax=Nocardia transvalensis TaxID=37333 RepID=UPI001894E860|nr:dCMP deaminase [Nocardia transvalensis]MBF6328686.1 dCMP deaminase [Nocardia transvalensis]